MLHDITLFLWQILGHALECPRLAETASGKPIDKITEALTGRGYKHTSTEEVDSQDYGLPQVRHRVYIVFTRLALPSTNFHDAITSTMGRLKLKPYLDIAHFLCKAPPVPPNKLHEQTPEAATEFGYKWPDQQKEYKAMHGMQNTDVEDLGLQQLTSRLAHAANIKFHQWVQTGRDLSLQPFWDISQRIDRTRDTVGCVPCITPGIYMFSSSQKRLLTGLGKLRLRGIFLPEAFPAGGDFANGCMSRLAGNAMSGPVVMAVILTALVHCNWSSCT